MNSTPFKLMHLSIVSNRILLLGFPEFKNGLKAAVEVSLMLRTLKNSLFKLKLFSEKTSCYLIQELDIRFSGQHVLAPIIVQAINISGVILKRN